jgi:Rrf2 family protein
MSLRMSTRCRYGVRLMVALVANYGNGISLLKDICRREAISEKYLGQIIIALKSAGLVISQRGSRGGYAMAKAPETVTVKDVVEAIDGKIAVVPCAGEEPNCARLTGCVATEVWKQLNQDIEASLSAFTLAALARQARAAGRAVSSYEI